MLSNFVESPLWKRELFSKPLAVLKVYVKEKLGLHLIAGFIVLLLVAAVFMAVGRVSLAEVAANCAYFILAAGVVLQLIGFGRRKMPMTELH